MGAVKEMLMDVEQTLIEHGVSPEAARDLTWDLKMPHYKVARTSVLNAMLFAIGALVQANRRLVEDAIARDKRVPSRRKKGDR